ncbi:Rh156 [macacine betaherpesvirus 3]|nr:Rh156 [macacine betaherpesvirus 3]
MDSRKRKPEDETTGQTEEGDPEEGTSGGPSTGPSPPKQARKEMALQQAVDLLEKMLADEEKKLTEFNLGDPLFEVTGDDPIKTLEEIIQEGDDVVGAHQLVGPPPPTPLDILAQAVSQAGIDSSSAGVTAPIPSSMITTTAPTIAPTTTAIQVPGMQITASLQGTPKPKSKPKPKIPAPPSAAIAAPAPSSSTTTSNTSSTNPAVCKPTDSMSQRKKSRKTQHPMKVIIKPPSPPTCMLKPSEIKQEGESFIRYKGQDIQPTSGCIVISDSEEEEDTEPGVSARATSEQQGVQLKITTKMSGASGQIPMDSSSSSSSDSECCDECAGDHFSSASTITSPVSPIHTPPPAPMIPSTSKGKTPKAPRTKSTKRLTPLDCERVRSAMKEKAGTVFKNPTVETKRGRVRADEVSRMFRATTRSLEYKNLPFLTTNVHQLMAEAVNACKTMQVNHRGIMVTYTRTHEVKEAVDVARVKLGKIPNLSISTPFLVEHTMPNVYPAEVVRKTAEACASGIKQAWDLKAVQPHDMCPRSSDYRNMIVHAATPVDFLGSLQVLVPLVQRFPKQVAIRIFTNENSNSFMLPIYDQAAKMYAVGQFEETKDEDLANLSMAIEKAIEDMNQESSQ